MSRTQFVGRVHDGKFQQLLPEFEMETSLRFTRVQPQEARPPISGEVDLTEYEGGVIAIRGNDQGGWIYGAEVVDKAGPILTAVVLEMFGKKA